MNTFWSGFEKKAGKITDTLRAQGANTVTHRREMAEGISKVRKSLKGLKFNPGAGPARIPADTRTLKEVSSGGVSAMVGHKGLPSKVTGKAGSTFPAHEAMSKRLDAQRAAAKAPDTSSKPGVMSFLAAHKKKIGAGAGVATAGAGGYAYSKSRQKQPEPQAKTASLRAMRSMFQGK